MTTAPIENEPVNALIYCRVSSRKQATEGGGLESQEQRCREYAELHGYNVVAVFPDDVSGGGDFINRAGMVALLAFLDAQEDKQYTVIFDDLKRFARDTEFHIKLRREFALRKATIKCLNFNFDDTPEGKFIETIFAAHGELERQQNGRQVTQKMKARAKQGFCVFRAVVGYKYIKSKHGGKILVRDEPLASAVQEALESFASGRFESQAEVKRFLEGQPSFPKDTKTGEITYQRIGKMLTQPLYAGYIEVPNWGISLREAKHDGLIDFETFEKIQNRINSDARIPARADISEDFPLRGFIACNDCGNALTACWSKSQTGKRYPYYLCATKRCVSNRKSIPRQKLENEFAALISSLQPSNDLFKVVKSMFNLAWTQRLTQAKAHQEGFKQQALVVDEQINDLLEKIVNISNLSVIKSFEKRIVNLERQKLLLAEKGKKTTPTKATFDELFELAFTLLANPKKIWDDGQLAMKRNLLKLVFLDRLSYCRKTGLRTPNLSLPFKMLKGDFEGHKLMVHRGEFESPTP
ncbi:MAG: recombinase family protein [Alphaproteobacteria bacterium]|nr:recombinase family protein [Alphaproteobacteria bacterium]